MKALRPDYFFVRMDDGREFWARSYREVTAFDPGWLLCQVLPLGETSYNDSNWVTVGERYKMMLTEGYIPQRPSSGREYGRIYADYVPAEGDFANGLDLYNTRGETQ